mgnify:CR=1 FL=1
MSDRVTPDSIESDRGAYHSTKVSEQPTVTITKFLPNYANPPAPTQATRLEEKLENLTEQQQQQQLAMIQSNLNVFMKSLYESQETKERAKIIEKQQQQQENNNNDENNDEDNQATNESSHSLSDMWKSEARDMDERPIPTTTDANANGTNNNTTTAFLSVHDLVHFAITTSQQKSATLREIYEVCEKHGRVAHKHNRKSRVVTSNGHWKSQVRHALYTSKRFTRINAKGVQDDKWRVIPQFANDSVRTVVVDDADNDSANDNNNNALLGGGSGGKVGGGKRKNNNNAGAAATKKPPTKAAITKGKRTNSRSNSFRIANNDSGGEGIATITAAMQQYPIGGGGGGGGNFLTPLNNTFVAGARTMIATTYNGQQQQQQQIAANIFSPNGNTAKRSLGQIMDEDLSTFVMDGTKFMRFSPHPSLNDHTLTLSANPNFETQAIPLTVNGKNVRPLSPKTKEIPVFGPTDLRNMKAKPRNLLRNRRKSSSASVGQAPCSPDAIDKLNEYFPKDADVASMFSFF